MERAAPQLTLLGAARAVARGGELDAKLDALAEHARSLSGASGTLVYLLDPLANVLLPAAQAGLGAEALDAQGTINVDDQNELVARVVRERRTLSSDEAGVGSRAVGQLGASGSNLISLPLVAADEAGGEDAEGALLAAFAEPPKDGHADDALAALADLCAIAIRTARLEHALQERADWIGRLSSTDTLTGLANRATLLRMLELEIARAVRQGTGLSLIVFDVDGFAAINERAGAAVADDVLRLVASMLADQVRLVDTVGRLGRDEFGLVAPGSGGAVVARRIQDAAASIEAAGEPISLSAGAAIMPEKGAGAEDLLAAANAALDEARGGGRGQLVVAGQG